jgi:hypothetical protein
MKKKEDRTERPTLINLSIDSDQVQQCCREAIGNGTSIHQKKQQRRSTEAAFVVRKRSD